MRCFISVNLPEEERRKIEKIQESLPDFNGKKTEFENIHLTLKFLGDVDENQIGKITEKLSEVEFSKFFAEVDSIGVFSKSRIRIVWLHLKGAEKLQKNVDNSLSDFFEKESRFMSHVTIARVKNVKDKKKFLHGISRIKLPKIKFNVQNFFLMRSELTEKGPKYAVVEGFNRSS